MHLILELCTGGELFLLQIKRGVFTEAEARILLRQMLRALLVLHSHYVAHRDLKLENWLLVKPEPSLDLKLCDFGFSIVLRPREVSKERVGSIYYVAPDVLLGPYDYRVDLWSMGVILFMLLSGKPPFNGAGEDEILVAVKAASVSFESPTWSCVSPLANTLILQLLSRDPRQRPSAEAALSHAWLSGSKSLTAVSHELG